MRIVRPVIVLGAPRSGTTILHRCLALHRDLWHLAGESHRVLEGPFHPALRGWDSNRVVAEDVDDATAERLRAAFFRGAMNLSLVMPRPDTLWAAHTLAGRVASKAVVALAGAVSRWRRPAVIRLIEKTPKNTLRVPMLARLFPDAFFVFIVRGARANVLSLTRGWQAVDRIGPIRRARFAGAGYPLAAGLGLTDYAGTSWKFALVPGWRALAGKTVADVAAWQWYQCNRYAMDDLAAIEPARVFAISYEEFVARPVPVVDAILEAAGLPPDPLVRRFAEVLPRINDVRAPGRSPARETSQVEAALARVPDIRGVERALGYA